MVASRGAPRVLVFRPLVKGNEASGNEIEVIKAVCACSVTSSWTLVAKHPCRQTLMDNDGFIRFAIKYTATYRVLKALAYRTDFTTEQETVAFISVSVWTFLSYVILLPGLISYVYRIYKFMI